MKSLKKLLSIFAAFMMVVGLTAANVKAADGDTPSNGSITIENPREGQTYTAYKIFSTTYTSDKSSYAYTISSDDAWYNDVQEYSAKENSGLVLTATTNSKEFKITIDDKTFNPSKFSAFLKTKLTGKTGTQLIAQTNGTVKAENLPLGYYFVSSTTGSLCNLTTTDPSADIQDKNDVPFEKNLDEGQTENVAIGDTVNYVITANIPVTDGFENYTYNVSDSMSDGLTFNFDSIEVFVGGTKIITGYSSQKVGNGFKLTFDMKSLQQYKLQTLTIKYNATVNEKAVADVETNKASLEYTNDPNQQPNKTPDKVVKVYTAKIVVNKKIDDANSGKPLAGAGFVLINNNDNDENKGKYYQLSEDGKTVNWVDNIEEATEYITEVTEGKAQVQFVGLKAGSYLLHEKTTPAGYNTLTADQPITITVGKDNAGNIIEADLTEETTVVNTTGAQLPSTGGMGTTMLYVAGAILMVGAAVIFVTNKRMKHE
ncbi:SpaH/EbpB family LPXTG-anchored major pilin [uncultured Dubosiella sp.]|uniref:SpaH/EbpB family LPXTG-anchored major pilin n=1 Tax=uncultured Dubosiella sp. TaxID=1937011 RepID=UPI0025952306|nr:SpaH/EbpB family LPXTG-anchored major pilin [uncultured Dubosiella sp.]